MKNNKSEQELVKKYSKKKNKWIKTERHGDQSIGNTLEDVMGVKENNRSDADYEGIELKTSRVTTSSLLSLFTKSPSPRGINKHLRDEYGVKDSKTDHNILHTTISGDKFNTHVGGRAFKIDVDRENKKLWLVIKDIKTNTIIQDKNHETPIYWSFDALQNVVKKKLDKMALIEAEEKIEKTEHLIKFTNLYLIENFTLDKMIDAIDEGDLAVDIRLGVYASGKNAGKKHDHGTAFRIKKDKLKKYASVKKHSK